MAAVAAAATAPNRYTDLLFNNLPNDIISFLVKCPLLCFPFTTPTCLDRRNPSQTLKLPRLIYLHVGTPNPFTLSQSATKQSAVLFLAFLLHKFPLLSVKPFRPSRIVRGQQKSKQAILEFLKERKEFFGDELEG